VLRELNRGGSKERKRNPIRIERLVGEPTEKMVYDLKWNQPHIAIATAHLMAQLLAGPQEVLTHSFHEHITPTNSFMMY
jgi:hypothetical protein